jgi:hypothetical protein
VIISYSWHFPHPDSDQFYPATMYDTDALCIRGDLWGLFAILATAKQAEIEKDVSCHSEIFRSAYWALPSVLKTGWINEHRELLITCLEDMRSRVPFSAAIFDVDWEVIDAHQKNPNYCPNPDRSLRDPNTGLSIEWESPILNVEVIPGRIVQQRRLRGKLSRQKRRK